MTNEWMIKMKESDMFIPIKNWLINQSQHKVDNVYAEVIDCDVVGLTENPNKEKISVIIEMKLHLNFRVIEQAIRATKFGNYVYVAVPKTKTRPSKLAIELLEKNRIGLLYVDLNKKKVYQQVTEYLEAPYIVNNSKRNIRNSVKEVNKTLVGGVKSGDGQTAYSIMIDSVKEYMEKKKHTDISEGKPLEESGWVHPKTLVENLVILKNHYSTPIPSISATLQENWNSDWCETIKKGRKRYFRIK